MERIKVAIIGSTGYTGIELVKILNNHPSVEIVFLGANTHFGKSLSSFLPNFKLKKNTRIRKNSDIYKIKNLDVVFSCLPNGQLDSILKRIKKLNAKIIDLSADYRLSKRLNDKLYKKRKNEKDFKNFQYIIPEINKREIDKQKNIANPGCYATSILLGLAPIIKTIKSNDSIIVDCKSGISGAGRSGKLEHIFSEANENLSIYNAGIHRHKPEVESTIFQMANKKINVLMVPHLLPITRGIMSNIYIKSDRTIDVKKIYKLFNDFYVHSFFIKVYKNKLPSLKDVQSSNFCNIGINLFHDKKTLMISSVIDNLVKGASGQAVQNMNLIFGFEERLGL